MTASRTAQLRSDATAPVTVIDRARIEASGATTLEDVLRATPEVRVSPSQGGAAIAMAGLDPEHTLLLVDGRPLAGRVDGTVDISRIPVEQIERIEILPGPASALYGSEAIGGVVNIVLRRDEATRVEGHARVGSRDLAEISAGASGSHGVLAAGASVDRLQQDGWDLDPADAATTGDDLLHWGATGWAALSSSSRLGLDADGSYRQRDLVGVSSTPAGAVFDTRALEESGEAALRAHGWNGSRLTGELRLAGSIWRQQYLENQRDSDVQDAYEETFDRRLFLLASGQWAPEGHLLVVGLDGNLEQLESDRLGEGLADRSRLALYAQDDWRVRRSPRLALSPGVRLDLDSQFGVHVTPNLAVRLDPVEALSLRLSGGRGYRAPEFKELYLALDHASYGYQLAGNPELAPETSTGANLNVRYLLLERVELAGEGWWNEVQNLIDPQLVSEGTSDTPAQYAYANVGRAVTRGWRLGGSWLATGPVGAGVAYIYTDARDREGDTPLDGRPPHRVNGNVSVRPLPTLELAGSVAWEGPRPYTTDGVTTWSEAYTWVDTRLAWTFLPGATLEVGARNLLEAQDNLYLGLPPRTLYAGIRAAGAPRAKP